MTPRKTAFIGTYTILDGIKGNINPPVITSPTMISGRPDVFTA